MVSGAWPAGLAPPPLALLPLPLLPLLPSSPPSSPPPLTTSPEARAARGPAPRRGRGDLRRAHRRLTGRSASTELVYAAAERFPELLPTRDAIDASANSCRRTSWASRSTRGLLAQCSRTPVPAPHLLHRCPARDGGARLARRASGATGDRRPRRRSASIARARSGQSPPRTTRSSTPRTTHGRGARDRHRPGAPRRHDPDRASSAAPPAIHPKYAGRRIFGSGMNLTHLYHGKISLVEFMLERDLGARQQDVPRARPRRARPRTRGAPGEAVDRRGRDVRDRRRVPDPARDGPRDRGDRLVLQPPGAQGGHHPRRPPTCVCPRFVGERSTRQAIFFNRDFAADSPEGRMSPTRSCRPTGWTRRSRTRPRSCERGGGEPRRATGGRCGSPGAARRLPPLHGGYAREQA